ncbi:universal stress protein [uncultured Winogradskyella sp.]|uniref:universal stress protein n=1 Tax=uncultured Winogradskyella sp. TaxID=395353 RepID=UPI0030D91B3A|tara:strand:+ start:3626 stop:4462 length:837 start_codon:yes stop_codon:yes gene_type:complete
MKYAILLPTDFSDNAWCAICYALKLYENKPCTFYLLHAWTFTNSETRTYITSSFIYNLKSESETKLVALKEKAKAKTTTNTHNFKVIFSTNDFLSTVKLSVKVYNIQMIIMGTKGRTGMSQILFGSNTVSLISKIKSCPILAVPNAYEFVKPKTIAFSTDYNRFDMTELEPLKYIVKLYNSEILIVHVNKENDLSDIQTHNLKRLKVNLEDYTINFNWLDQKNTMEDTIKYFINTYNINLLAMVNYKHSFLDHFLKASLVKKIGFNTKVPFLVLPSYD